jgi:ribonuclease P protein component
VSCESHRSDGSTNRSSTGRKTKFPRSAHLLRHVDFERVYKQGRRHFAAHMTVFYLARAKENGNLTGLRVGFTVSRALGGAVDRNRMKRRLREAVRSMFPSASPAADVVINPKKSLRTADFAELLKEVGRAFEVIQKHVDQSANERASASMKKAL